MKITSSNLMRLAGLSAVVAGAIFAGMIADRYGAGRVVGGVDDDGARPFVERRGKLAGIDAPVRFVQPDEARIAEPAVAVDVPPEPAVEQPVLARDQRLAIRRAASDNRVSKGTHYREDSTARRGEGAKG